MNKKKCFILNLIVSIISIVALAGYFIFPFFKFEATITFNEDVANIIFDNVDAADEDDEEEEASDDILSLLVKELAEENISLSFSITIDTTLLATTAISASKRQTQKFIYSIIDELVESLNEDTLKDLEDSIAKASVSAAIKVELSNMANEVGAELGDVMQDIGISDEYINESTTAILDAINSEDATVDSVTTVIVDVVKDVYDKYGESSFADEYFEELTPENEEMLREELANILSTFADDEGNFNGDGLVSSLISQFLFANGEGESEESEEACLPTGESLAFSVKKYLAPQGSSPSTDKPINQKIADSIKEKIDDDALETIGTVTLVLFAFLAFSAVWWLLLLIKIIVKIGLKNPLIKLKAPIIFGGLPCIFLFILPTSIVSLLANPPSYLTNLVGEESLATVSTLFGEAIKLSFSSSSIIAFVCGFILFIFGFYYAKQRRAIKREIKYEKRAAENGQH